MSLIPSHVSLAPKATFTDSFAFASYFCVNAYNGFHVCLCISKLTKFAVVLFAPDFVSQTANQRRKVWCELNRMQTFSFCSGLCGLKSPPCEAFITPVTCRACFPPALSRDHTSGFMGHDWSRLLLWFFTAEVLSYARRFPNSYVHLDFERGIMATFATREARDMGYVLYAPLVKICEPLQNHSRRKIGIGPTSETIMFAWDFLSNHIWIQTRWKWILH